MPTRLLDDLRRLGLPPGAPVSALKPAWRRVASQLHPDRHGGTAAPALAEANAALARLEAFARVHGRLPGPADLEAAPSRPARSGGRRTAAVLTLLAAGVFVFWPQPPAPAPAPETESLIHASGPPAAAAGTPAQATAPASRPSPEAAPRRLVPGMSKAEVERLLGSPVFRSDGRWEYGPSSVHFAHGRVAGWYSSPLRPLPVATPHASPEPPTE